MRDFTDIEKELIVRMNSGQGNGLYSLVDRWIKGVSFEIDLITNRVRFIFDISEPVDIVQRLQEIQEVLIQAVNLIKLFEDKGFIFTVLTSQQFDNPLIWGRVIVRLPSIPYNFPDTRISELIAKYSTQEIFVTPELNRFISDGFITREEWRANRQYRVTRNALIVSIIALFANLGFNIYNKLATDKRIEIKNSDVYIHGKRHSEIFYSNHCHCMDNQKEKNNQDSIDK